MKVWVTGANGMLGREVVKALAACAIDVVGTGREVDITNAKVVDDFIGPFSHVINCAAYTSVDACETHEADAMRVNADGPANLAHAAGDRICVHVSTDYVFPGTSTAPYEPEDLPGPINAYGRTKLAGEARFHATNAYIVRTSWLFGNGANFVATMLRLFGERDEVKVVDDQRGRPTYAPDFAAALVELALRHPAAGIYHFANAEPTTWYQLAIATRDEARARGRRVANVVPIATRDRPTSVQRPAFSVLSTTKIERAIGYKPRPWREALAAYFEAI